MTELPNIANVEVEDFTFTIEDAPKQQNLTTIPETPQVAVPSLESAFTIEDSEVEEDFEFTIEDAPQETEPFIGQIIDPNRNQLGLGFERGVEEVFDTLGGGLTVAGSVPGLGFVRNWGEQLSAASRAELEKLPMPNQPDVIALWNKLQSGEAGPDEAMDWLAYTIGNAGPSMAAALGAGVVGSAFAAPLGATAVGGMIGLGGMSYLLGAGEVYNNLRDQGFDEPVAAAKAGIPIALLDVIVPGRVMGKVLGKSIWRAKSTPGNLVGQSVKREIARDKGKRVGGEFLLSAGSEGLTEAGQEAIGAAFESPITGDDFFSPQTAARMINAFAAGTVVGGFAGAGGQVISETFHGRTDKPLLLYDGDSPVAPVDVTQLDGDEFVVPPSEPSGDPLAGLNTPEDVEIIISIDEEKPPLEPGVIAEETLWNDPNLRTNQAPKGASRLLPTHGAFILANEMDNKARYVELATLFSPILTDTGEAAKADVQGVRIYSGTAGSFARKNISFRDDTFIEDRKGSFGLHVEVNNSVRYDNDTMTMSSNVPMTPVQYDSTMLHEMIHHEMAVVSRLAPTRVEEQAMLRDSHTHGAQFVQRMQEVSEAAGIPITTTHNYRYKQFTPTSLRTTMGLRKAPAPKIAKELVDTLIGFGKVTTLLTQSPQTAAMAFKVLALKSFLDSRNLKKETITKLINDAAGVKQEEVQLMLERVVKFYANPAAPVVELYHSGPEAMKMQAQAQMTAPDNTHLVIAEPQSLADYQTDGEGNYVVEAQNVIDLNEKMGHVLAEAWLSILTPEMRERLEQVYLEENRQLKDSETMPFGEWAVRMSPLTQEFPELNRLDSALRSQHAETAIPTSYEQWLDDLAGQTQMPMANTTRDVPNPGRGSTATKDEGESLFKLFGILEGIPKNERDDFSAALDKSNWFIDNVLTLLQFEKLNKHIQPLVNYVSEVQEWWASKTQFTSMAVDRATEWEHNLSKKGFDGLSRFLLQRTIQSFEKERVLDGAELDALARKHKVTPEARILAEKITGDMREVIAQFKALQMEEVARLREEGNDVQADQLEKETNEEYGILENRDYFPLSRFGKHVNIVTAANNLKYQGKDFKKGDTIVRRQYDRAIDAKADLPSMRKEFKADKFSVGQATMTEADYSFQGFAPSLVRAMENELNLSKKQRGDLNDIMIRLAPGQGFMKHHLKRRGIEGFSEDGVRVYKDYMLHASNHFARLKHYRALSGHINDLKGQSVSIMKAGGNSKKRNRIVNYMNEHYKYLMDPGTEAASIRSFIFKWYFVGNMRQGIINMTQVPLFTWSNLAAQFGDVSAGRVLAGAYRDVFRAMRNPEAFSDLENQLLEQGIKGGFLNESFATELAAQDHGSLLARQIPKGQFGRMAGRLTDWGLLPFKATESVNRKVSFLGKIRLMQEQGITDPTQLFEGGRETVQTTQFEYNRWARIPLTRGNTKLGSLAPVAFMFKSYLQGAIWFYAKEPGRGRAVAAMLLLGGLMGLPGSEDVSDIIDGLGTRLAQAMGMKDPLVDSKKLMREALVALNVHPDLAMHGVSRYTMGLYGLNHFAGLPIPALDVSSSVSLGRVLPVLPGLASVTGEPRDKVERAVVELAGVAGSLGVGMGRAMFSDNAHDWQQVAPPAIRGYIQSGRAWMDGGYADRSGARLVPIDPFDNEHSAELLASAILAANPTRVTRAKEKNWAIRESRMYYMVRRELVLKDLAFSTIARDPEGRADALKALRLYNHTAPPGLRISSKDMKKSLESRIKNRRLREMGLPSERRFVQLYREFDPAFPQD